MADDAATDDDREARRLLENAYRLSTPADSVAYYRDFAAHYDGTFAATLGWSYPRAVAQAYVAQAGPDDAPVADIGCGTGFVAQELAALTAAVPPIDGLDISPDMLAVARGKGLYRSLHEVDLTGGLSAHAGAYGAVLSAGTFTHGHLGPETLRALHGLARPGALFVIGVNAAHFQALDFAGALAAMTADGLIGPVATRRTRMYDRDDHAHSDDVSMILTYRAA